MDFFHTHISLRAKALAAQVLESGWISEGRMVKEFEQALADRLGLLNPVALNSGTSALHLALVLAGIGRGDEVIIPAQTFVATGLVVLMQGAKPVFSDINPKTGNLDPQSIKEKINERTKAIMPVHWGGYPCDMEEILKIADQHGCVVIEDAAHAIGAVYKGKPVGSISHFTAFSFQAIKHLTTGDGGALSFRDNEKAHAALVRRWFGIDRANSKPSVLGEREYDIELLGFKYHMNDLAAAIGLGNLDDFPIRLARRQQIGNHYRASLHSVPGLTLLECTGDRSHAYWLFTVLVERREDFIHRLSQDEIPASVVHLRIDRNSIFGGIVENLPGQTYFNNKQVAIPVHEGLTDGDVDRIIRVIKSGW
jgi:perosamine synthetase